MATAMSTSTTISKMTKPGCRSGPARCGRRCRAPKKLGTRDLGRRPGDEPGQLVVVEVDVLDRDRRGDRDDGQLHAADAHGGQADQQPDEDGDGDAGERGERPRQARDRRRREVDALPRAVGHHAGHEERRHAGQRHLEQRDLSRVAGEHDEREHDDDEHERRLDGAGEDGADAAVLEHEGGEDGDGRSTRRRAGRRGPGTATAAVAAPRRCRGPAAAWPRRNSTAMMTMSGSADDDATLDARPLEPVVAALAEQRVDHAEGDAAGHRDRHGLETADQGGGEGRDDQRGQADRRDRPLDRTDEDGGEA